MKSNFLNMFKMQLISLSQIVWLQMLCIILYPMFFSRANANNKMANVIILGIGLLMLTYLIIRNFAFNDAKYKTHLLFGILPITTKDLVCARGIIVYLFCLFAIPVTVLFSYIYHSIKPNLFASVPLDVLGMGVLLASVFIPLEFVVFEVMDTQKADIVGALVMFPFMGLMSFIYRFLLTGILWIVVLFVCVATNSLCFVFLVHHKRKIS